MKVTFLDFRKRPKALLKALEQNEEVTILYRGRLKGGHHACGPFGQVRQGR